ncbi:thioredoxin fold domain-containing protein [Thermus caldilimi]|uniref:thioredoxin fold domain-containing protein n=1 Tax=Thermus caldilimi TaxID=2483360 RepID=UPI0010764EAC|nr:thioredoxin fold domain-containing protein [Thermus caldilimi]
MPRWLKRVFLGVVLLAIGLTWGILTSPARSPVVPTSWVLEEAWPYRKPPFVLLFMDPLCPFCQRLEEALSQDADLVPFVRYVPVTKHQGSFDLWVKRLKEEGWTEEEAERWVQKGIVQAALSGAKLTPTTVIWRGDSDYEVIVGFRGYEGWAGRVKKALGLGD